MMHRNLLEDASSASPRSSVGALLATASVSDRTVASAMRHATAVHFRAPLWVVSWSLAMSGSAVAFVVDDELHPIGLVFPTHLLRFSWATLQTMTASEAIAGDIVCVDERATLGEAAEAIAGRDVRWVAVCEDERLQGCLSAEDLYGAAIYPAAGRHRAMKTAEATMATDIDHPRPVDRGVADPESPEQARSWAAAISPPACAATFCSGANRRAAQLCPAPPGPSCSRFAAA